MDNTIRAALVTVIKSRRQRMSRAQRQRGVKPQRWLYPWATESRYATTIRAWLRPMKVYVHTYLKENQEAILRGDSADGISALHLDAVPGKSFRRMIDSLTGWLGQYVPDDDQSKSGSPIYMGLGNIADSTFDFNEGQYEKGAKSVLGVEFPVGEDWWPDARDTWRDNNYQIIKNDMRGYISRINALTEKAVTSGFSVKTLAEQIHDLDSKITKGRANYIARDQIGKLNGEITHRRMESIGLSMYIWETSGDERVRGDPGGKYPNAKPSHYLMDGLLCRWDNAGVYSEDGGKTWIDRPTGAVALHPGEDSLCRCTAIAYWQELVGEADAQIEPASEGPSNTPKPGNKSANLNQQQAREQQRRQKNARKAKESADKLYPGEQWKKVEDGIYLSPRRPIGAKSNYKNEKWDALILSILGSIVYLIPDDSRAPGNKFDAIVNGLPMEFKNIDGNANTLKTQFLKSRSQAPNVFINLEKSNLTKREAIKALFGARNNARYAIKNKFKGGIIILKIKGQKDLIYLNVDELKI
jgi:hypothetical protein